MLISFGDYVEVVSQAVLGPGSVPAFLKLCYGS